MKRAYRAADARGFERCSRDIVLDDGSGAQCMRGAVLSGLCKQHAEMRLATLTARCAELEGTEEELREIIREFLSFEMSAEFKDWENYACWCEAIRTARAALAKVTT